jgi:hypothetical protein
VINRRISLRNRILIFKTAKITIIIHKNWIMPPCHGDWNSSNTIFTFWFIPLREVVIWIRNRFMHSKITLIKPFRLYNLFFSTEYPHSLKLSTRSLIYLLKNSVSLNIHYFSAKKILVLDLDETLIHCSDSNSEPADIVIPISFPTGDIIDVNYSFYRPGSHQL